MNQKRQDLTSLESESKIETGLPATGKQTTQGSPEQVLWLAQSQPSFRHLDSSNTKIVSNLTDLLLACSFTIGIDNVSDEEASLYAVKVMKMNPDLNSSEVAEAFDLYAMQMLDFKTPHYNKFDLLLIGNILTSYKRYKRSKLKDIKKVTYQEPEYTREEQLNFFKKHLFTPYQEYLKKDTFEVEDRYILTLYKSLEDLKVINIPNEEKIAIASDVRKELLKAIPRLIKLGKAKKQDNGDVQLDKLYFQNQCRLKSFKTWIAEMKFSETNIEVLITSKI